MIINSFPKIVKNILRGLPKNDYPVLNSRLFVECWLAYALDNSLTSMRDLFKRLNNTGNEIQHFCLSPDQEIDFMSVDVEGIDLEVLKSNDWSKYKPKIVLVEILDTSLSIIDEDLTYQFMTNHGYQLYAKLQNTFVFVSDFFI